MTSPGTRLIDHYLKLLRCETRLTRLHQLSAPSPIIEREQELITETREQLEALDWNGNPVKINHSPWDPETFEVPAASRVALRALVLSSLANRAIGEDGSDEAGILALQDWARSLGPEFDQEMDDSEKAVLRGLAPNYCDVPTDT